MKSLDDTIAAIVTPIGEGGISVVRISGKQAIEIADKCFQGKQTLALSASHTAHFGRFYNAEKELIDEVVATIFKKPHSYTAEDIVEISCHGGILVTRDILAMIVNSGARLAEPGEFTKRSFLNGRIDLSQAEAVADIIKSKSEISRRVSVLQLEGILSQKINEIKGKLLNICSYLELELDFVEEGIEFVKLDEIGKEINEIKRSLKELTKTFHEGRIYREGVKVVIVGKPNVGKSSILNALLSTDRAIVTEIPGTTRDTIEENLVIDGILFKIVDTAGLRSSTDIIELEGLKRTEKEIETTDIKLFVIDASEGFHEFDRKVFQRSITLRRNKELKVIVVINKIDLVNEPIVMKDDESISIFPRVKISAKTGLGIDSLKKEMINQIIGSRIIDVEKSPVLTNSRHLACIQRALTNLQIALNGLKTKKSNEFIAIDMRAAMNDLGEITGIVTNDDILNNIFSKFCIGK